MAQDLRVELSGMVDFITTRTIHSELWMVNNSKLQERILAYLACNQERYGVKLYAFAYMGNHFHILADFPGNNRASFMRDFNSIVARLINTHAKRVERGPVWGKRFSTQAVPTNADVEDRFFYTNLNPVHSGLAQKLSEYTQYNSFFDSIKDIQRTFKVTDSREYNDRKRFNKKLRKADFTKEYKLVFTRLPGYENLSQGEYELVMRERFEERRIQAVQKRLDEGKGFATKEVLLKTKPGAKPKSTKTSNRDSKRPLVLTSCPKARKWFLELYFTIRSAYTEAYNALKNKDTDVQFPTGTYPPVLLCVC